MRRRARRNFQHRPKVAVEEEGTRSEEDLHHEEDRLNVVDLKADAVVPQSGTVVEEAVEVVDHHSEDGKSNN